MSYETDYEIPVVAANDVALEACKTTSDKIRLLTAQGMARAQIAKILGIRYQHVRNVQITPTKKA
jgi:hypothetical protein